MTGVLLLRSLDSVILPKEIKTSELRLAPWTTMHLRGYSEAIFNVSKKILSWNISNLYGRIVNNITSPVVITQQIQLSAQSCFNCTSTAFLTHLFCRIWKQIQNMKSSHLSIFQYLNLKDYFLDRVQLWY